MGAPFCFDRHERGTRCHHQHMSETRGSGAAVVFPILAMVGIPLLGVIVMVVFVPLPYRLSSAIITGCAVASFGCGAIAWVRSHRRSASRGQWLAVAIVAVMAGSVVGLVPRLSKAADFLAEWHLNGWILGDVRWRVLASVIPLLWCGMLALSTRWKPARWAGSIAAAVTVVSLIAVPPLVEQKYLQLLSQQDGWRSATVMVGKPIPDFALKDIDGRSHRLSEFRGRLLIVNVWRTWCHPCIRELPLLASLQQELAPQGVAFVGMCDDTPENQRKFAEPAHIEYPLLVETDDMPPPFDRVAEFPVFLLVKKDGTIYGRVEPRDRGSFMAALEAARQ